MLQLYVLSCSLLASKHCQVTLALCTGDMKSPEAVQLVSKYHQEYIQKLQALYDAHKDVFFSNRVSDMRLVK